MFESNRELEIIVNYMKKHWPSQVKSEWQVTLEEYPGILKKVIKDFTTDATRNSQLIRVTGISGSGKTTQIMPAVDAYCEKNGYKPILVAARRFVEYHPHCQEIKDYYGEENLRKMTDEFSTILMFMTLAQLIDNQYDIVLDVTLISPDIESILLDTIKKANYRMFVLMMAVSPKVTEKFLLGRKWRHAEETEKEFIRATEKSLEFYASSAPGLRIILWSAYDESPIYDGPISGCLEVFKDYSSREDLPKSDDDARRQAKINYLIKLVPLD